MLRKYLNIPKIFHVKFGVQVLFEFSYNPNIIPSNNQIINIHKYVQSDSGYRINKQRIV